MYIALSRRKRCNVCCLLVLFIDGLILSMGVLTSGSGDEDDDAAAVLGQRATGDD
jgi:hypothetical protein